MNTQPEASWVSGVYYNKKFHWALNGSGWKMTLDETGSLEIGANNNGASTGIKINNESANGGITGYTDLICEHSYRSALNVYTSHYPQLLIRLNFADFMEFNGQYNVIRHYKPLSNSSDDRLKENEVLITNACETLYKLRPQIYDKSQT